MNNIFIYICHIEKIIESEENEKLFRKTPRETIDDGGIHIRDVNDGIDKSISSKAHEIGISPIPDLKSKSLEIEPDLNSFKVSTIICILFIICIY